MMTTLRVLRALSSTYDSLAQDYTGEAKGELSSLIGLLEDREWDLPGRDSLIADCLAATSLIRAGKKRQAVSVLLAHSNELWKRVLSASQ